MRRSPRRFRVAGIVAFAVFTACTSATPPFESTEETLSIHVDSSAITLARGSTRHVAVSVTASGTSAALADVAISGLPAGLSAIVARLSADGDTEHFRVAISATTAAASGSFLLRAVASRGRTSVGTDLMVTVPDIGIVAEVRVDHSVRQLVRDGT